MDIDYDEGYIYVNKTAERLKSIDTLNGKTKVVILNPKIILSNQLVPIPSFLLEYISNYNDKQNITNDVYFILTNNDKITDSRTTQYNFSKLCKILFFNINFHSLRHNYAINCVMHIVDTKSLSEILGHSNVGVILNLYVHSSFDFKKKQIDRIS